MDKLSEDQIRVQKWIWSDRQAVLDMVLLHDCEAAEATRALVRLSGMDLEDFILLALADVAPDGC